MSKHIGGFFELELDQKKEFYPELYSFNFARHAIVFYFKYRGLKTVWLPTYICNSVINTLNQHQFKIKFYNINNLMSPSIPLLDLNEGLLLVNYFGCLNFSQIYNVSTPENILIDNSQAFFSNPENHQNVVYSARKFFGIPDGAYLKTTEDLSGYQQLQVYKIDNSSKYLINAVENGTEETYAQFKKYQEVIKKSPPGRMSLFSNKVLGSIEYKKVRSRRNYNFSIIHRSLKELNLLELNIIESAMCYPLLIKRGDSLRKFLIDRKIFVPQYWKEVLELKEANDYDLFLAENIVCLPIDQRYGKEEMDVILQNINEWKSS